MSNLWHIKNWFRVGHNISWKLDFYTLGGFLFLYHPCKLFFQMAKKKHDFILAFLRQEMNPIISKYKEITDSNASFDASESRTVWTLWWQGEANAPTIVKKCIESMRRNANGAEVIVVTRDNFSQFIQIPEYILRGRMAGWISFAQLSDIIRFLLLEQHGGLWLDSTIYVASPIPENCFLLPFYSQHTHPEKMTCWVQNNLYHGFIIGSRPHAKLVSFAKEVFLDYWKCHDTLVDYLMIDYILMLAYQEFPDVKSEIDSLPWSSEKLYDMVNMLNKPYNRDQFSQLKSECLFSKLDWHIKYKTKKSGEMTLYGFIINE